MHYVAESRLKTEESVIEKQKDLDQVVSELDDVIGMDTEFHRRRTFFPRPCVLQLSTSTGAFIVDLLAPLDLTELESALFSEDRIKVTHSPREDLELLHLIFGAELPNLVDVQLAHAFLSTDAALNYSSLVERYLDHPLEQNKKMTQSDWRKRPLTPTQVKYAYDDVRFLLSLWDQIRSLLKKKGRLSWFLEEMQHYFRSVYEFSLSDLAAIPAQIDWNAMELTIYFGLLEWRERTARSRNRPRERVLTQKEIKIAVEHHAEDIDFFQNHFHGFGKWLHRLISIINKGNSNCNDMHYSLEYKQT
ncbi:MAG: ribonuclease D, partial [Gammaproteobacteria bacterium]|nr:ribonuclease D [Gammaproteobacteria bacterium]